MKHSIENDPLQARPSMFTEPFGLLERLKKPKVSLDFVPVMDLAVIALLVSLLFTRFVVLPGVSVDLPATDMRLQHSSSALAVLTIGNNGMLFFNGSVYDGATINRAFGEYIESSNKADVALLMKVESGMQIEAFMELCQSAQKAGFAQVQIAGQRNDADPAVLPANASENPSSVFPAF